MNDDAIEKILSEYEKAINLNATRIRANKKLREEATQQIREYINTEIIGVDESTTFEKLVSAKENTTEKPGRFIYARNGKQKIEIRNELRAEQRLKLEKESKE